MNYFLYIIRTENNRLYIGHTNNPARRIQDHQGRLGAKFIKDQHADFRIIYTETFNTRAEAMLREQQLKRWTRAKKEALVSGNLVLLKCL